MGFVSKNDELKIDDIEPKKLMIARLVPEDCEESLRS